MRRLLLVLLAALALPGTAHAAPQPTRWCGTDVQAGDRQPDAVSGFQFHVVYAFPADGGDGFAGAALPIARDLAAIDEWWRAQDGSRAPRFDLFPFPGCDTEFGNLDLSRVQLPQGSQAYRGERSGFRSILADLGAGFADPDKKYLVFYDGPVDNAFVCGRSPSSPLEGGPEAIAVVYVRSLCEGLGSAAELAVTAVHEVIHNLGALPAGAPNRCPGDDGHPCDSEADVLYPSTRGGDVLAQKQLDIGRDDYYGHGGPQWDVQDSPWLEQLHSPDRAAPTAPASLTATSSGSRVRLSWGAASDETGVRYRIYRDGELVQETGARSLSDTAAPGATVEYGVRARDGVNHLGERRTIRFTVGLGIVDEAGRLLRDTVAPGPVRSLRARRSASRITLTWAAAADLGRVRVYSVTRNGRRVALTPRRTLTVPAAASRGVWAVRAIDLAGNLGAAGASLRVR